ncbi:hypothetical protein CHUAL_006804 [Chamberlinius hualienensis]
MLMNFTTYQYLQLSAAILYIVCAPNVIFGHKLSKRQYYADVDDPTTTTTSTSTEANGSCLSKSNCIGGPIIDCTSILDNVELLEKSICALDDIGTMGVCCPINLLDSGPRKYFLLLPQLINHTWSHTPVHPMMSVKRFSTPTLMSPQQQNAMNTTLTKAISLAKQQDKIDQSVIDEGSTVDHDSSEELHNLITFADTGALQLGKKGLIFTSGVHSAGANESSMMPLAFSQSAFQDSPIVEACNMPTIACLSTIYRTYDGSCNNLLNVEWGKESRAFNRLSRAKYADGFSMPRVAIDGKPLPSCRTVSTKIIQQHSREFLTINSLFMGFGQFVDHDLSLTPTTQVIKNGKPTGIQCCSRKNNSNSLHPECLPISIPNDDPFYHQFNQSCMGFVRTLPALPPTCSLNPREQMNSLNSYLDGSPIYGSTEVQALLLREFQGGRLRIGFGNLGREFPPNFDTDRGCIGDVNNGLFCFEVGDIRSTEQPLLGVLHTIFLREHNRVATQLSTLNPTWNDETLYQETRKIVIAVWQRIIYNEYLPLVLGNRVMKSFNLNLEKSDFFERYDLNVDPTLLNEFATAAFRYGHSLVQSNINLVDENGNVQTEQLFERFLRPFNVSLLDSYIRGSTLQASQRVDENLVQDLTNRLFQRNGKFGLDLAAINCQRGRDHAIGTYAEIRQLCGLGHVNSFNDLNKYMNPDLVSKFSQVYENVADIDLWVGGVVERPIPGGVVGPVFACIIAEQFKRLRFGDRFWFENGGADWSFKQDQLEQIRKASLARIICDNSDVTVIQPLALMLPAIWNPKVACNSRAIPEVNLQLWKLTN